MSGDRSFFQQRAHEVVEFFEFVIPGLAEGLARQAVIRDLGGTADLTSGTADFPTANLDAIKTYRDTAQPGVDADLEVMRDILVVLDAIASNVETWELGPAQGGQELGHSLLDLFATNYVRHQFPRAFMFLQAISAIEDATSTFGPGDSSGARLGNAFASLGRFLASPGRTLDDLDAANAKVNLDTETQILDISVDTGMRLAATVMGVLDGIFEIGLLGDTLVGWDAPGLDVDAPDPPTRADVISSRMISFSIAHDSDRPEDQNKDAERLQLSLLYVPKRTNAPPGLDHRQLFLAFGGALTLDVPLGATWKFTVQLRSDAGVAALISGGGQSDLSALGGDANFAASVGWASQPNEATGLSYAIPRATGTRLEVGALSFSLALASTGAEVRVHVADSALVIDGKDNDGFMRTLLGGTPVRLPFDVVVGYNSEKGRILEAHLPQSGGATGSGVQNSPLAGSGTAYAPILALTIPLGRHFGPVTIQEISLRISRSEPTDGTKPVTAVEADISFSAQIGPVYLRVDRLGLALLADTGRPPSERNLRLVDLHLGIKAPLGIAVNIDTALISGGGTIFHDPAQGIYFGALTLRIKTRFVLKAIGLVSTRNPDGTPGSSFIVIATLEGLGWPIGPVVIDGLGVLYASDRTFDEVAMRAALPTGQLRNVLFPADPVHHPTETMQSLSTFFPTKPGSYLAGLMVKLTFGRTPIVRLDLALIFQWGASVSDRLIVLGRLSSILPDEGVRIVNINLDAVGVFDFTAGTAAMDAVLVDSKLCGRFALTGSAAFRRVPGSSGFALAIGGFHPAFRPPDGFPVLTRITIALTTGDNPKLICQAYLAITSNTVQFGANASLYAAACGFSIEGEVGFDVLVQIVPFHYLAEFRASVQLKRGSTNLFKVSVEGALEGGVPLRVRGKATFEILWCDFSVGFDKTLVDGSTPQDVPTVDGLGELMAQLRDVRNWQAEPPPDATRLVSQRRSAATPDLVVLHPLGTVSVSQGVVPLASSRDIDRIGAATPSGARRFAITKVSIGPDEQDTDPVSDQFAPAQFFDLTDDEKLAAPSFELMQSGVSFGDVAYGFDAATQVNDPFHYTDITIGPDGQPVLAPAPHVPSGGLVRSMLQLGAAALAPVRRTTGERFAIGPQAGAPSLRPRGWAVAEAGSTDPAPVVGTWAEAQAQRGGRLDRVLVPTSELTG
jgi:hypothetical protein